MRLVIPFTIEELAPETKALGEKLGADFVDTQSATAYFELLEELWAGDDDFINWEHDVLPTEALIHSMGACPEEWCSGTFGRWFIDPNRRVLKSDSWTGLMKFGAIRKRLPDTMARALGGDHTFPFLPERHFENLCRGIERVLGQEEGLSPHLHFPVMRHCKWTPGAIPGQLVPAECPNPWGQARYESDLADALAMIQLDAAGAREDKGLCDGRGGPERGYVSDEAPSRACVRAIEEQLPPG